jgi:alkanesulfonate monooxygenase SsuD/methylene tetrahydromethanopterin reductase-like flavin-dependent oxidoreductase (luciferase family)
MEPIDRLEENYALHREAFPEDDSARNLDVPIMRTVFITRDRELAASVREALEQQTASLARSNAVRLRRVADSALEDWALVGEPAAVSDAVAVYRERLGMTHLIVRPGISGIPGAEVQKSLELIAELSAH